MVAQVTPTPPVITVDVEDWPQSTLNRDLPITPRAERNARHVMQVLDELGAKATMFVLGKFAETFPFVVRDMHAAGHEIASHGYGHVEVFHLTREQFAADLRRSKDHLEQLIGAPVVGYRAPDFSIVRRSLWGLDVLAQSGFVYDSSIFPADRPRYGIGNWPTDPRSVQLADGREIVEFPIGTLPTKKRNVPIGGGGYVRLLPGMLARNLAARAMRTIPFVFYCHPYEFDPQEFRAMPFEVPWKLRLHQSLGRRFFEGRFRSFIQRFGSQRMIDLYRRHEGTWPEVSAASVAAA